MKVSPNKQMMSMHDRFWSCVNKSGPVPEHAPELGNCWVWTGRINVDGYGMFRILMPNKKRLDYRAHRFAKVGYVTLDEQPLSVLHRCDERTCVRPSHTFLGTQMDNMRDMVAKGRQPEGRKCFSSDDVVEMFEMYGSGAKFNALKQRFGVGREFIRKILRRDFYAWVAVTDNLVKAAFARRNADPRIVASRVRDASFEAQIPFTV